MGRNRAEMIGTKEKIASCFKELVCKKSFAKITITDISNSCGMTRENFYYHFHDKYDIVCWIFEREIHEKMNMIQGEFPHWFFMFLHYLNRDYNYYKRVFKVMDMTMLEKNLQAMFAEKIRIVLEANFSSARGIYKDEKKEKFIVDFAADSFVHWVTQYVLTNDVMEEENVMNNFQYLFTTVFSVERNLE